MTSILNQDRVILALDDGEHCVRWVNDEDYLCEEIMVDRQGVLYVEDDQHGYLAVGVVVEGYGTWTQLAETHGGSMLGKVRNSGWQSYETRGEWEESCERAEVAVHDEE